MRPTACNPHLRAPEPRRGRAVFLKQSRARIRHPASKDAHPSVRAARRSRRRCRHRIIPCAYRDDLLRRFIAQYFIHFCHHLGRVRDRAPRNPAVRGGGEGCGCGGEFGCRRRSTYDACGSVHQPAITPQQERHLSRCQRSPTIRHNRVNIFNRHATRHHRAHRPRRRIRYCDSALGLVIIKTPEVQNCRIRQDGVYGRLGRSGNRHPVGIRRQDGQPILAVVGVEEVARHRRRIIRRHRGPAGLAIACIARARQPHRPIPVDSQGPTTRRRTHPDRRPAGAHCRIPRHAVIGPFQTAMGVVSGGDPHSDTEAVLAVSNRPRLFAQPDGRPDTAP